MEEHETEFLTVLEANISILIKIARVYAYTTQDRKDLINDIILELWKSYPPRFASISINLKYILPRQFKRLNEEIEKIRELENDK